MIKSIISYNPICPSEVFKAIFNKSAVVKEPVKTLEFKMDASLDDEMDTFIPEGTVVNVWPGPQREGSTRIIYNGEVIEYMNFSFKGGK